MGIVTCFESQPWTFEQSPGLPLTDDTIYELNAPLTTRLDPFLSSIALNDHSFYLKDLPPTQTAFKVGESLQQYLEPSISEPIRIKANQKVVIEFPPHSGAFYGFPDGMMVAHHQLMPGYNGVFLIGQASQKGTYPVSYSSYFSCGAQYLHFVDLIVE